MAVCYEVEGVENDHLRVANILQGKTDGYTFLAVYVNLITLQLSQTIT